MHNGSNVATFIAGRIETSGQLQKDIAEKRSASRRQSSKEVLP